MGETMKLVPICVDTTSLKHGIWHGISAGERVKEREERDSHSQQLCAINKSYAAAGETHKTFISLFTSRKLTHSKADEMVWLVQEIHT